MAARAGRKAIEKGRNLSGVSSVGNKNTFQKDPLASAAALTHQVPKKSLFPLGSFG